MELRRRCAAAMVACLVVALPACSGGDGADGERQPGAADSSADQEPNSDDRGPARPPRPGRERASTNPDEPDAGVEIPAGGPSATAQPRPRTRTTPLAARPWPGQAAAPDQLVDGFPADLGPVRRSTVVSSSLAPAGARLQVALEATTQRRPAAVLRAYRIRMARHGLRERKVRALGGSQAIGFRRGDTAVTVTVTAKGSRTSYTVLGVVHDAGE